MSPKVSLESDGSHSRLKNRTELTRGRALERLVVMVVIVAAIVQALVWALTIPIFQNPDEQTHSDYAFVLAQVGHPIIAGDRISGSVADPLTNYLAARAHLNQIAFHSDQREDPAYGSLAFYRQIDTAAPWAAVSGYAADPGREQPRLINQYPVGYYALAAIGARIGQQAGSAVGSFFAMRFVSIALFAFTLLVVAALLKEARLRRPAALALLLVVAFFPEVVMVASSVQPDNLTDLLFPLAVLLALRYRRTQDMRYATWCGLALGALLLTKPFYFIPCTVGCALALLLARQPPDVRHPRLKVARALILPIAIAFAINTAIMGIPGRHHAPNEGSSSLTGRIVAALEHGPAATAHFVADESRSAFVDFLWNGETSFSYWGDFGWLDTPLSFGSGAANTTFRDATRYGSVLAWLFGLYAAGLTGMRLSRVARTRGIRSALRLAFGDPVTICFIAYCGVMLALHVAVGIGGGFQGRYWFPIIALTFVMTLRSLAAPWRSVRTRRIVTAGFLTLLVAYSVAGSAWAIADIRDRYYTASTAR